MFVDGCFWHGCPTHATWPKQNAEFWRIKILGNQRRDLAVNRVLKKAGWRVIRIWEHALTKKNEGRTVARLLGTLRRSPSKQLGDESLHFRASACGSKLLFCADDVIVQQGVAVTERGG